MGGGLTVTDAGRRAVFLDRDGTLIVERHYLADPAGVRLVPGCVDALRRLRDTGYLLVVVTNQSGIDRGLYTLADYHAVAARLSAVLEREGVLPDATYFCPHHPEGSGPCDCRKPATGMHRRAAADLGIDLAASWYVGDKRSDVLPARVLGGKGVLVRSGYGREAERDVPAGVSVVDDVAAAARLITGGTAGPGSR